MSGAEDSASQLSKRIEQMLEEAWREPGFCVPNPTVYGFQWLWDSCFHSLIWASLGNKRCLTELENVFANQHADGFVPHINYWGEPDAHAEFWGQSRFSPITQPPMYGHCVAELHRRGFGPIDGVATQAAAGLANLLARPRTVTGLVPVWHPWETGCDDSPRWDDWCAGDFDPTQWRISKAEMVASLVKTAQGAVRGSEFEVGSVGFNALVVWNIDELASVGMSNPALDAQARTLTNQIPKRWDGDLLTWTDSDVGSGQIRTLDAALCLLVDPRPEMFVALGTESAYGAPYGPRGVHLAEPSYNPNTYWRGPAWPQLSYLLWMAARRAKHPIAARIGAALIAAAQQSGLAEYWNPETGTGLGAKPQSWSGLALLAMQAGA